MSNTLLPVVWQTSYELEALKRRCASDQQRLLISILYAIRQHPSMRAPEIAELLGLPAETLSTVLQLYDASHLQHLLAECVNVGSPIHSLLSRCSS